MYNFSVEDNLKKYLKKSSKKDKVMYDSVMKKMDEIINCENVNHYKNLKSPLNDFKRVHVRSSFVLIFKYIESEDKVVFYDLYHHDNIYNQ